MHYGSSVDGVLCIQNTEARFDDLVKSQNCDGKVKSSICKARKTRGERRTYKVRRNDEGEAQRRRWTFYEAIRFKGLVFLLTVNQERRG